MKADLKAMTEIELIRYERELGEEMTRVRNHRWEILDKKIRKGQNAR